MPGSIRVDRPSERGLTSEQLTFVAMYAQIHGGGPGRGADDAAHREHYFAHCLDAIVPALPRIDSIAFPKYIGCEIAGGNWDNYGRMIRQFAGLHPHLQVFIVERGPVARLNGQPISPTQHHRVPGSQSSRSTGANFVRIPTPQRCECIGAASPAPSPEHCAQSYSVVQWR